MSSSITADLHEDTRLIERRLAKGFMSRAEAQTAVEKLPDLSEKADWISIEDDIDSDSDED